MKQLEELMTDLASKVVKMTEARELEWEETEDTRHRISHRCQVGDITVTVGPGHDEGQATFSWSRIARLFSGADADRLYMARILWQKRKQRAALHELLEGDSKEEPVREETAEEASPPVELSPDDVEWAVNQIANLVTMRELVVHERTGGWQITVCSDCWLEFDNRAGTLIYKGWAAPVARAQLANLITAYSRVEDVSEARDDFLTEFEQRATCYT